jgi:hypothetical protein
LEKVEKGAKQMNHNMEKNMRLWLVLLVLLALAFLAALWASLTFWFQVPPWEPWEHRMPSPYEMAEDLEFFYTAETVVSTINVTLLVFLLITYASIYRKTKSEFTVGLMVFSVVLLLNAIASSPFVLWVFGFRSFGLGPFALLPDLFTFAALIVLLYLSIRY